MRLNTLLIASALAFCSSSQAATNAKGLAWVCAGGLDPENVSGTMLRSICRSVIEGFVVGTSTAMGRVSPGKERSSRCAPDTEDFKALDAIAADFVFYVNSRPELAESNYGRPLKDVIDKKYPCKAM